MGVISILMGFTTKCKGLFLWLTWGGRGLVCACSSVPNRSSLVRQRQLNVLQTLSVIEWMIHDAFYRAISVQILHRITMVIPNELDKLKAWIIYPLPICPWVSIGPLVSEYFCSLPVKANWYLHVIHTLRRRLNHSQEEKLVMLI